MKRRSFLSLAFGSVALALVVVSTAFACTAVQGTTTITSPSPPTVRPGGIITATGTNSFGTMTYYLRFLNSVAEADQMMTCMGNAGQDVIIGGPRNTVGNGDIPPTRGVIPSSARRSNTAVVCFTGPNQGYSYATDPAMLTVL